MMTSTVLTAMPRCEANNLQKLEDTLFEQMLTAPGLGELGELVE